MSDSPAGSQTGFSTSTVQFTVCSARTLALPAVNVRVPIDIRPELFLDNSSMVARAWCHFGDGRSMCFRYISGFSIGWRRRDETLAEPRASFSPRSTDRPSFSDQNPMR
jgi:hypothetical protein